MSYLGELRDNIRPLAAASIGCATGLPLLAYAVSAFAPHLVADFGWSRAQFALIGLTQLTTLLLLPFIGRFTDHLGVWRMALLGTMLIPVVYVLYSLQQGSFTYYFFCSMMVLAVGSLSGPMVYVRLVAENFERARGLALTIINCAPALVAMALVPLLNWCILQFGWRVAYLGMGAVALVGGIIALTLIGKPKGAAEAARAEKAAPQPGSARDDYGTLLRSRTFWIVIVGMFLCMLQTPLHASQMNMMLIDNGITTQMAANVVSLYAFGTIVGRIACGLALDRYPTPIVSAVSLALPAMGFVLLGTDLNSMPVIAASMFLVGLSVGAESDIMSFLVARYFKLRIFSTTLSLLFCATFLAAALGSGAISLTLRWFDTFSPYLYAMGAAVLVGGLLFLLLPSSPDAEKVG